MRRFALAIIPPFAAVLFACAWCDRENDHPMKEEVRRLRADVNRLCQEVQSTHEVLPPDSAIGLDYYPQGGVVVGDTAFFTSDPSCRRPGLEGKRSRWFPYVCAFDVRSFNKLRAYPVANTYDSAPFVIRRSDGTSLVIAREYELSRTIAVNRERGHIEWISTPNHQGVYFFGFSFVNTADGRQLLLAACENGLHAVDTADGKEAWCVDEAHAGGVTPCVDQELGFIFYQCSGAVLKIRAADGVVVARRAVAEPNRCVSWNTVLARSQGKSLIATYWHGRPEWDSAIRVFDSDLNPVWEKTGLPCGKKPTLTYARQKLVVGCGNRRSRNYVGNKWKRIIAYDIQTGDESWKCDLAQFDFGSIANVPYHNGYFYAETQDDPGYTSKLFRIDGEDGRLVQTLDYGRALTSCAPSIIAYGMLFSGNLWEDRIVVTRIAADSSADWPGPFCDPQTNTCAVPGDGSSKPVEMREIVPNRTSKGIMAQNNQAARR